MKIRCLVAILAVVSVVFMGTVGGVGAADEWFVLAEQPLKTLEGIVEIKSQGSPLEEGHQGDEDHRRGCRRGDQEGHPALGQSQGRDDHEHRSPEGGNPGRSEGCAKGRKARLTMVSVQYKLQGGATAATVKVWGYD